MRCSVTIGLCCPEGRPVVSVEAHAVHGHPVVAEETVSAHQTAVRRNDEPGHSSDGRTGQTFKIFDKQG